MHPGQFRQNSKKCNTTLSVVSITAIWVNRRPISSSFLITTLQQPIYHFMEALMPAAPYMPAFLSVYVFDSDYDAQLQQVTKSLCELDVNLMPQFTDMLHHVIPYVLSLRSLIR